jgi:hypothetical protein
MAVTDFSMRMEPLSVADRREPSTARPRRQRVGRRELAAAIFDGVETADRSPGDRAFVDPKERAEVNDDRAKLDVDDERLLGVETSPEDMPSELGCGRDARDRLLGPAPDPERRLRDIGRDSPDDRAAKTLLPAHSPRARRSDS